MGAGLDLDELGQLAKHFVILGDLFVVAAVRHVGIELRHVAEQLVAFEDIGIPVEDAERRERPLLSVLHFFRHCNSPASAAVRPDWHVATVRRLKGCGII